MKGFANVQAQMYLSSFDANLFTSSQLKPHLENILQQSLPIHTLFIYNFMTSLTITTTLSIRRLKIGQLSFC